MSLEPTPSLPTFAERLDHFVAVISKVNENDIKGRLNRLSDKEQKYLDAALEIFKSHDDAALSGLTKLGTTETLDRIQKILEGKEARITKKTKLLGSKILFKKIEEAKDISQKRRDPFKGLNELTETGQLQRLRENGKWEETYFRMGLKGILASQNQPKEEIKRRMNVFFANFEKWTKSYSAFSERGSLYPEVDTLFKSQISLQEKRLNDLKHLNTVSVDFQVIRDLLQNVGVQDQVEQSGKVMSSNEAKDWITSLKPYTETKNPVIKLKFLELLNNKSVDPLLRKLNQSMLSGVEVVITPQEENLLEGFSNLDSIEAGKTVGFGIVRLWFLQFMTRNVVNEIKLFSDQVTTLEELRAIEKETPFTNDALSSLHFQIVKARVNQENEPTPLLADQIEKGRTRLLETMQAREARQTPTSSLPHRYISIQDRLFELGEMDGILSLLDQSQSRLRSALIQGFTGSAGHLETKKNDFLSWAQGNSRRAELLKDVMSEVREARSSDALSLVNRNIGQLFSTLRVERTKLFDQLNRDNLISADGLPNILPMYAIHYSQDSRAVIDIEDALLAQRETALFIANEISLYEAAKTDPTLHSTIQKLQVERAAEISKKIIGLDPASHLVKVYEQEKMYLEKMVDFATRPTTLNIPDRIKLELSTRQKHLAAVEDLEKELLGEQESAVAALLETEKHLENNRHVNPPSLKDEVKDIFQHTEIYPKGPEAKDTLDKATTRRNFFYVNRDEQVSLSKQTFDQHEALLTRWGFNQETIPDFLTFFSGTGQFVIYHRSARFFGDLAVASERSEGEAPVIHQYPHLSLVKNDEGNYEIYMFNVADIRKFATSFEAHGYDIGLVKVTLDGKAIEEGKSYSEAVLDAMISPPLRLGKDELQDMAQVEITAGQMPPEAEKAMLDLLLDSIGDKSFREGARSILTAYQKTL